MGSARTHAHACYKQGVPAHSTTPNQYSLFAPIQLLRSSMKLRHVFSTSSSSIIILSLANVSAEPGVRLHEILIHIPILTDFLFKIFIFTFRCKKYKIKRIYQLKNNDYLIFTISKNQDIYFPQISDSYLCFV